MNNIVNFNIIKQEYLNGATLTEIEDKFDIERHSLSKILKADNVTIRKKSKKYNHNEDAFYCIDSETSAYWLGFLYANGHVITDKKHNGVYLTIQYRDFDHLCKFRDFISAESPVRSFEKELHRRIFKYCRLDVFSKKIAKDLENLGCIPRKSSVLIFPTSYQVPKKWLNHFIEDILMEMALERDVLQ